MFKWWNTSKCAENYSNYKTGSKCKLSVSSGSYLWQGHEGLLMGIEHMLCNAILAEAAEHDL